MNLTEEKAKEFRAVARPLMDWLRDNCHPHVIAIVTSEDAEALEGFVCDNRNSDQYRKER